MCSDGGAGGGGVVGGQIGLAVFTEGKGRYSPAFSFAARVRTVGARTDAGWFCGACLKTVGFRPDSRVTFLWAQRKVTKRNLPLRGAWRSLSAGVQMTATANVTVSAAWHLPWRERVSRRRRQCLDHRYCNRVFGENPESSGFAVVIMLFR